MKTILFLVSAAIAAAQTYSITTFAGGAPPPTPVAPLHASIGSPQSIVSDTKGNFYFTSLNCVFELDQSGSLTRIAGNSRAGYSGDGGPAVNAQLFLPDPYVGDPIDYSFPSGLAVDSLGDVYVADQGNKRVRRISADGIITTVAGGGTAFTEGAIATTVLLFPSGLAVDAAGNLYISDFNSVRKVSSDGSIHTVAGSGLYGFSGDGGPAISAEFNATAGLAMDGQGNLYIADVFNNAVRKVTPQGIITSVATGIGPVVSLAVDSLGNIYAGSVDGSGPSIISGIHKVTPDGVLTTVASNVCSAFPCGTFEPWGLALDNSGSLFIAGGGNLVRKMATDGTMAAVAGNGTYSDAGDGGPATSAQFVPMDVALDSGGNLYILDAIAARVRKVSRSGMMTTVAGTGTAGYSGDGGPATSAQIDAQALAVDAAGNLYIGENARVRKVLTSGTITTIAGNGNPAYSGDGGPALTAQLSVSALATDSNGNLYIADTDNNRVRKISPDGIITTFAGNGHAGMGGDGGPAINVPLSLQLQGLAVDSVGNLFIANGRVVRKVSQNGIITTVAGSETPSTSSGDGGPAIAAGLGFVTGLAIDQSGDLFIADSTNGLVRRVSPDGIITTLAGARNDEFAYGGSYTGDGGPAASATFTPGSLVSDSSGNVYLADEPNKAVRLLQPMSGMVITAVQNAASGLTGPVAPGEIVVLTGSGLGPDQLVTSAPDSDGLYGMTLAGTTVQINGVTAHLIFTWATQVAAIVPESVSGSTAAFTVTYQGSTSAAFTTSIALAAPGIFTADFSGKGNAATINQNGAVDAPAEWNDTITLFATGLGQMSPTVIQGGGIVSPLSAGNGQGAVEGVTQIKIPIQFGTDCAQSIVLQVGGASSQPGVTIPLRICI